MAKNLFSPTNPSPILSPEIAWAIGAFFAVRNENRPRIRAALTENCTNPVSIFICGGTLIIFERSDHLALGHQGEKGVKMGRNRPKLDTFWDTFRHPLKV